jgi:hypothetical protein
MPDLNTISVLYTTINDPCKNVVAGVIVSFFLRQEVTTSAITARLLDIYRLPITGGAGESPGDTMLPPPDTATKSIEDIW